MSHRQLAASALAVPLLLVACVALGAEAERPAWTDRPYEHERCDRRLYLCGLGSAAGTGEEAARGSHQRALQDLVASVLVEVESVIDVDSVTRRQDEQVFWVEEIAESIRLTTRPEDVPGAEVVECWRDPARNETWTLVSVRRDLLLDQYLAEVGSALSRARSLLADAAHEPDPVAALKQTLSAWQALAETYGLATRAKVVGAPSPFGGQAAAAFAESGELMADASTALARMLASVRVTPLSGDGQRGRPGGALALPLRARLEHVDADGSVRPLVDLPVSLSTDPAHAAALVPPSPSTDAAGEVTVAVVDLHPTGRGGNAVLVGPDLLRLAPDLPPQRLPAARFGYQLPTPGETRVLVAIEETFGGQPLAAGTLGEHVADHLSRRGFDAQTTAGRRLLPSALSGRTPAELRLLVGDDVDVVVRGEASTRVSSRDGELVWFRASAELQAVELPSGLSTAVATGDVREAARDDGPPGAVRALQALRQPLLRRLDETFVARYLPELRDG